MAGNAKEALKGHTFVYEEDGQQHKFKKTVEEIAEYCGVCYGPEMRSLVRDGKETVYQEPVDPGNDATPGAIAVYKEMHKEWREDSKRYIRQKASVFAVLIGQCSTKMKDAVKNAKEFKTCEEQHDVVGLLEIMKKLSYGLDDEQYKYWNQQAAMTRLYAIQQGPKETLAVFTERFKTQLAVTESVCGELTPRTLDGEDPQIMEDGREAYLACLFMARVCRTRFKSVIDELCNDYHKAKDKTKITFPETIDAAVKLLTKRRGPESSKKDDFDDGFVFHQSAVGGKKKKFRGKCHKCDVWGHKAKDCTASAQAGGADDDRSHASERTTQSQLIARARAERRAATSDFSGFQIG